MYSQKVCALQPSARPLQGHALSSQSKAPLCLLVVGTYQANLSCTSSVYHKTSLLSLQKSWRDQQDCRWLKLLECTNNERAVDFIKRVLNPRADRRAVALYAALSPFINGPCTCCAAPATAATAHAAASQPLLPLDSLLTGSDSAKPFVNGLQQLSHPWTKQQSLDGSPSLSRLNLDTASLHPFEALPGMMLSPQEPPICEGLAGAILR